MKKHKRTHSGEKTFKCEQCGKCYIHYRSLSRHRCTHTGKDHEDVPGGKCGRSDKQARGGKRSPTKNDSKHVSELPSAVDVKTEEEHITIKEEPIEVYMKSEEENITLKEPIAVYIKSEEENITLKEPIAVYIKTEEDDFTIKEEAGNWWGKYY